MLLSHCCMISPSLNVHFFQNMQLSSSHKRSRLVRDRRYARLLCARPTRFDQPILRIIVHCWFCQIEIALYLCCFVLCDVFPPLSQGPERFHEDGRERWRNPHQEGNAGGRGVHPWGGEHLYLPRKWKLPMISWSLDSCQRCNLWYIFTTYFQNIYNDAIWCKKWVTGMQGDYRKKRNLWIGEIQLSWKPLHRHPSLPILIPMPKSFTKSRGK